MVDVREQESGGKAFRTIFDLLTSQLHTAMPGIVTEFDGTERTCSVQPALKRLFTGDEEATLLPIQEDVPVLYPGSNEFYLEFELKSGDEVLCVVSERAIDQWLDQGGPIDPQSSRRFSLSDIVVIAGLKSKTNIQGPVGEGIALRNAEGDVFVRVKSDIISNQIGALKFDIKATGVSAEPVVPLATLLTDIQAWNGTGVPPPPGWVSLATHTHPIAGAATGPPTPVP